VSGGWKGAPEEGMPGRRGWPRVVLRAHLGMGERGEDRKVFFRREEGREEEKEMEGCDDLGEERGREETKYECEIVEEICAYVLLKINQDLFMELADFFT